MIELKNVTKTYQIGKVGVKALDNISLSIEAGEFVAIMGSSGSGKSTLLHILDFLDRPDSGSYMLLGREVGNLNDAQCALLRNHLAGFVFQQFHLLPRTTAIENIGLPLIYAGKRNLRTRARQVLGEVGLSQRASHRPNELSGGEQQRVAIARSLVNEPILIFADEPTGNLDTKNEEEIIKLLKELNEKGKTIVMVTHEREIAEEAKRIITMRDGKIISDEKKTKASSGKVDEDVYASLDRIFSERHFTLGKAEFKDHLRQAFLAVLSHKMRSFLSVLGILIGVAAVIAMLAIGQGAKASIAQRLSSLGSNLLVVRPGSPHVRGVAMNTGVATRFTMQDVEEMSYLPEVARVSPSVRGSAQVVHGNKNRNTRIQGEGVNYPFIRGAQPVAGRFFTKEEILEKKKVAVVGMTIVKELFGGENPVGQDMKINRINFRVIGVLPLKGASPWYDRDDLAVIPVSTAMYRVFGKKHIDSIDVEIREASMINAGEESLRKLIMQRHRLNWEKKDTFQIRNMKEIREAVEGTTKTVSLLLGCIAAIALFVGGIGIMNIMLVSVTERTKEIGLRKAIGAKAQDIMTQFLIEAVVMTFSGGFIGIMTGIGVALLLSVFTDWAIKVTASSIILAFGFSIAVGILFGLLPAKKAATLDPIASLRYE